MTSMRDKKAVDDTKILLERKKRAKVLAASPTTTVTFRIPSALNEWLTEYHHLAYPVRIKKGQLIIEGLMLAYLRRGRPGEKILSEDEALAAIQKLKK